MMGCEAGKVIYIKEIVNPMILRKKDQTHLSEKQKKPMWFREQRLIRIQRSENPEPYKLW